MRPLTTEHEARPIPRDASRTRSGLAWGVHAITASGAVIGTIALMAIAGGRLDVAAVLMLVALAIDSFDGTLARAVGVSEVLPAIDGRRLDDIVDFLNYVIVPAVFMIQAGSLPHWAFAIAPVLASCYGFSHVAAKTPDDFFQGFPSYWNVVAIYLWGLEISPVTGAAIVLFLSVMVFVPLKYAYPSKMPILRGTTAVFGFAWTVLLAVCVLVPERARGSHWLAGSLVFPAYYLAISFFLSRRSRA